MRKIGEVIQHIQSLYSQGVQSDDSRLRARHIYGRTLSQRAQLIRRKRAKKQKIDNGTYIFLPCVELIKAAKYECPCLPKIGCDFLKVKNILPSIISHRGEMLISSITSVDGSVVFSEKSWDRLKYRRGEKFTRDKPVYYFRGEDLFIEGESQMKALAIRLIPFDPLEAQNYPLMCQEGSPDCTTNYEKDFMIDSDLMEDLIEITVKRLTNYFYREKRKDERNNSKDDAG